MLVVKVELHSAITGEVTEIARSIIYNDGAGTRDKGDYKAFTLRGRNKAALDASLEKLFKSRREIEPGGITRAAEIKDYPRLRLHVWNLVAKALGKMGYGHGKDQPEGWD